MPLWRDIPGYDGRYQVSSDGQVRSVGGTFTVPGRWGTMARTVKPTTLKAAPTREGYLLVGLQRREDGKKRVNGYVHKLVATAFVSNPGNREQVNHIDGNKLNNSAGNLEWVTASENHMHRCRVLQRGLIGESHPRAKLTEDNVREIRASNESGPILAERYGVSRTIISKVRRRMSWVNVS